MPVRAKKSGGRVMAEQVPENARHAAVEMNPDEFRRLGHQVVDELAEFLTDLPERPVTRNETPGMLNSLLPQGSLPDSGRSAEVLLREIIPLLTDHSLFNGHPRFWGFITSSPTPIGALADLIAGVLNPNVGGWLLSPIASEIELQTVRWIAELVGYPTNCGGVLGSGGNVANFIGFLAARKAKARWDVRAQGLRLTRDEPVIYASPETHLWLQKASDLFGFGTDAIHWIPVGDAQRMRVEALEQAIADDRKSGKQPFLVVGAAGTVSTGAVDPLPAISEVCRREDLWFHVDGAYGAFAAALPEASEDLKGLALADSVAMDPHKWLYAPLEAGCTLVRNADALEDAFSFHPVYYHFEDSEEKKVNFYERGLQNSRGFRALKVWLALRQAGREGVVEMIRDDVRLTEAMFKAVTEHPELEAVTRNLSIATFRYVPADVDADAEGSRQYLNELNTVLLERLQNGGELFVSNAVVDEVFLLRACIVNFRSQLEDVLAVPEVVARYGREVHAEMKGPAPAPVD
jgi:aromatic-L-amino-acid decarboxylase